MLPRSVQNLIDSFQRLPGIGPKTAARLTFYLLHVPQKELDRFSKALARLKRETVLCSCCFNISQEEICPICQDYQRDRSKICVVEQPLDVLAIEKSGSYKGLYHVLHGVIDPLNNIGPEELKIDQLIKRIQSSSHPASLEIILATNPTMEGEATAMYLLQRIRELNLAGLRITRLGRGIPVGGDLQYADPLTLTKALEGRREY